MIPYDQLEKDEAYLIGRSKSVMILNSMSSWSTFCVDCDNNDMVTEAEKRSDLTIDSNDERFPY